MTQSTQHSKKMDRNTQYKNVTYLRVYVCVSVTVADAADAATTTKQSMCISEQLVAYLHARSFY